MIITGARQKNLKNVSLEIPKNKITVFTGVSGSGKSTLVLEAIGAEAQRQIHETQNSFVRNRSMHIGGADKDKMDNLNVPVIINQKRLGECQLNCWSSNRCKCFNVLIIVKSGGAFCGLFKCFFL